MNLEKSLKLAREDNTAFKEIYDLTINRVYSFVLLRIKDKAQALDISQEIYLSLWNALPKFRYNSEPEFYAFLWTIARRQISRARIKNHSHVDLEEVFDIPGEDPAPWDYRVLLREVEDLKEQERLCVELRYFKDLKFQDIAGLLNISENYAKVLHHRAITKLRDNLKKYE